ncbi:MAG: FAD/NAD(P)-binding protein [Chloroflexi bacterium]|nr:FAD/NAD(P)-binding protein [Chloroflexota bacterium]
MRESVAAAVPADPFLPTAFAVTRVQRETGDTATIALRPPDGDGFVFQPGQFNMLYLFGVGEVPISVSGASDRSDAVEHTIRSVGTVTRGLTVLRPGDWVGLRGPFGRGWPLDEAKGRDLVIVAGGLGLAPLRPAIRHVLAHRADYRHVAVLYGTRTPADLLFRRELERWRGRLDWDVLVTVDRADPTWRGNIGVVPRLIGQVERVLEPANTVAFLCGPEIMMRFTERELRQRGIPPERIYLSLERNMKCAIAMCGHCQYGPLFICKDGPVFPYSQIEFLFEVREI